MVQWLRLCSSAEAGHEFSPWQGKTLHAAGPTKTKTNKLLCAATFPHLITEFLLVFVSHSVVSHSATLWSIALQRGSFWPRDWTQVSGVAGGFSTIWATREWKQLKLSYRYMCETIMLYTVNLHNVVSQLYLNKAGKRQSYICFLNFHVHITLKKSLFAHTVLYPTHTSPCQKSFFLTVKFCYIMLHFI